MDYETTNLLSFDSTNILAGTSIIYSISEEFALDVGSNSFRLKIYRINKKIEHTMLRLLVIICTRCGK